MKRTVLTLLLGVVLTACLSTYGTSSRPTPVPFITPRTLSPSADPATATSTPTPSPAPSPTSTPSAAAPPPAAAAPAAAPPAAPMLLSRSFPLMAVGGSFVRGLVQVTDRNGAFTATVSASGLSSGASTLHTVHIHLGSCANPYGGMHLIVLGLLGANSAGAGTLTAPLAPVYVSAGHYVIVYASTSPQVIVGCANLASLA